MTEIVIACTVLLALIALGDVISCWTKALIPSMGGCNDHIHAANMGGHA